MDNSGQCRFRFNGEHWNGTQVLQDSGANIADASHNYQNLEPTQIHCKGPILSGKSFS